jgi:hypothetical protein
MYVWLAPDYENKANMQSSQAIADYDYLQGKVLMQQQIPGTVRCIRCSRVIYYWN